MSEVSKFEQGRELFKRALHPRSKLGKVTLGFGVLALVLQLWSLLARAHSGTMLSVWASLITYVFVVCAIFRGWRWARHAVLWRLRNRLIVTYIFIGVIPIVLLISMFLLAAYLFAGQFATYVALADLDIELQHLRAANNSLAVQYKALTQMGRLTPQLAAEVASASNEMFSQRTVTVLLGEKGFVVGPDGKTKEISVRLPSHVHGEVSSLVMDRGRLHMRAVRRVSVNGQTLTVISNAPMTEDLLLRAARVGSVNLYPPSSEGGAEEAQPTKKLGDDSVSINLGGETSKVKIDQKEVAESSNTVKAGMVTPATSRLDPEFLWWSLFTAKDWENGKDLTGAIVVGSRPSMLYNVLFTSLGTKGGLYLQALAGIGVVLGLIELVALFIGVRLTRSMTNSVAELYAATQAVNRGDFSHRIQVRTNDQLATLEESFNLMSASLSGLMAEQKEKQRLESELAIAHEVQALLFPGQASGLPGLEVHGICRPARTVSGDYYDFIPLGNDRILLAVGDISGKGISAALLMATVHAFVRAYSLEPALEPALAGGGGNGGTPVLLDGPHEFCAPGSLMATLNYQVYRSTPPEKYATMFLGSYDGETRTLTYSNAGHLPPIIVRHDGSVERLEVSGTVVGLFDGMTYGESRLTMDPGDIFVGFSDGLTEPENEYGEFGEERLIDLIKAHRDQPLSKISEVLTVSVADWIGGEEQPDDVTLVLARAR